MECSRFFSEVQCCSEPPTCCATSVVRLYRGSRYDCSSTSFVLSANQDVCPRPCKRGASSNVLAIVLTVSAAAQRFRSCSWCCFSYLATSSGPRLARRHVRDPQSSNRSRFVGLQLSTAAVLPGELRCTGGQTPTELPATNSDFNHEVARSDGWHTKRWRFEWKVTRCALGTAFCVRCTEKPQKTDHRGPGIKEKKRTTHAKMVWLCERSFLESK